MTHDPFRGYDAWKTATPYDDDPPCELCERDPADCVCPLCPVCRATGDPDCYDRHDLTTRLVAAKTVSTRENIPLDDVLECFAEFLELPKEQQQRLEDYFDERSPTRVPDA